MIRDVQPGGHPNIGMMLGLILPLVPIILLLVVAGISLDIILRDFMLPHYALEDASAGEAWSSVWARITAEKGQFFAYALLRLILPTIAGIAIFMILLIPGLVLAGAVAGMELGIHSAFANSTGSASVAGIMLQVFFGLVAFGFFLLASICLGGPLSTGTREYAILFYGGRYQVLGDLLYPQPLAAIGIAGGFTSRVVVHRAACRDSERQCDFSGCGCIDAANLMWLARRSGASMVVGPGLLQHRRSFLHGDRLFHLLIAVRGPCGNQRRDPENI